MLAAIRDGDAKRLGELIRQDTDFKVNMGQDGFERTLLHYACWDNRSSPVIPLLLAHPDIDVNQKNEYGWTPF